MNIQITKSILRGRVCIGFAAVLAGAAALTSCEDFFEQESDHVIYADQDHLNNAVDTIYSVTGVMDKLQLLADRTILLGELRGDLVEITDYAPAAVRQIYNFEVDDDNIYNSPRDYYAVINNCNYFIAKADTALKNNRNEYIFKREYAAMKAFRAWTYLQLALNYGEVRFVTEPILTKQQADAESSYPLLSIQKLCDALIQDLSPLVPEYAAEYPQYTSIGGSDTRFSYFPLYIMLGELNLWAGHYREAALSYYNYIATRNGMNGYYYTNTSAASWGTMPLTAWRSPNYSLKGSISESYTTQSELITQIPISVEYDSVKNERYNQLRVLFTSRDDNDYHVSLVPSKRIQDISEEQVYCMVTAALDTVYPPRTLDKHLAGDLRLQDWWYESENFRGKNNEQLTYQSIYKYRTRNVHIWRRQMVYLRLAEAMNMAGYPRFAFKVLEEGISNQSIEQSVLPYYTDLSDSTFIKQFDFPNQFYVLEGSDRAATQQGIHSRGCGDSRANAYYKYPEFSIDEKGDTTFFSLAEQQDSIERMIVTEEALELAFEGHRYYDLMRVALRRGDPAFLANRVAMRSGTLDATLQSKLMNKNNWYLKWNGKLGLGK